MIRSLCQEDWETVISIVNKSWQTLYTGYVAPSLVSEQGCQERAERMKRDFVQKRLSEYVWEENGQVLALLSIGDTADVDAPGAFELWHIYIDPAARGGGIGTKLLSIAEKQAREQGYTDMLIWAFRGNIRALTFYQKHGYRVDKEEYMGQPYETYGVRLSKKL